MNGKLVGIICILLAAVGEAYGQISFKRVADGAGSKLIRGVLRQYRWIAFGISGFVAQAIFWTLGLRRLDLSLAYPLGSFDLVVIALLCRLWLHESVGARRWAGVAFIVAGTALIGSS